MRRYALVLVALLSAVGCASRSVSTTARTAIEQLLLSEAVDRALEKFELPVLAQRKVFLNDANLKAYDVEYIRVATRARLAQIGALLIEKPAEADFIVELASGGLGTEYKTGLIGIPAIPVPGSPVALPEAPIFKTTEQTGIFKLLIFVHANGRFVAAGQYYAKCDRRESFLLWWRFHSGDDIRTGWERADLKLESKLPGPAPPAK